MDNRNKYIFIQSCAPSSCFSKLIKDSYQKDKNVHSTIVTLEKQQFKEIIKSHESAMKFMPMMSVCKL